jgi:hypothetical protein
MWAALILGGGVGYLLALLPRDALWAAAVGAVTRPRLPGGLAPVVSAILAAYVLLIAAPLFAAAARERAAHTARALAAARMAAAARAAAGGAAAAAAAAAAAVPLTDSEAFPGSTFTGNLQRRGSLGFLDFLQPVLRRSLLERALRMTSDALAERRGGGPGGATGGKPAAGSGDAPEAGASAAAGSRADAGADAGAGAGTGADVGDVLDASPGEAARRSPAHRAPARDRRAGSSASSGSVGTLLFTEPAPR